MSNFITHMHTCLRACKTWDGGGEAGGGGRRRQGAVLVENEKKVKHERARVSV